MPPTADLDMGTDNPTIDPVDPPYFMGPGRGSLGVFYATNRYPYEYYVGTGQGVSPYKELYQEIRDHDSRPRADITYWAMVTYDPQSDPNGQVPGDHILGIPEYFTVPTFDAPVGGDIVAITETTFNNTTKELSVTATNTNTTSGYELHAIHSGNDILMTEGPTGTWTATFTGYPYDITDQSAGYMSYLLIRPLITNWLTRPSPTRRNLTNLLLLRWNGTVLV